MHYIDAIFGVVICVFIFFGFRGGIVKGVVAVLSLVVGLVVATRSMHELGEMLTKIWSIHEVVGAVLAFVLVLLGVIIAQILVVAFLSRRSDPPHFWSKLCGGLLGLVEGAIYMSLLLVILNLYAVPSQQAKNQSKLYRPLRGFAPLVFDATNSFLLGYTSFYDEIKKSFEKFRFIPFD